MDVTEAAKALADAEKKILALLRKLQSDTGLTVSSIDLYSVEEIGSPGRIVNVRIFARIDSISGQGRSE